MTLNIIFSANPIGTWSSIPLGSVVKLCLGSAPPAMSFSIRSNTGFHVMEPVPMTACPISPVIFTIR